MQNELAIILGMEEPVTTRKSASSDLRAIVRSKAEEHGIDPDLADRWVAKESGYNPKAKSPKGALGLLQLMPATASQYGVQDATDPVQNVDAGMRYLKDLRKKYGNDDVRAFAAYNAGPGAVDKAGGVPNYPETKDYVKSLLGGDESHDSTSVFGPAVMSAEDADKVYAEMFGDPSKYADKSKQVGLKFEDNSGYTNAAQKDTILGMGELYRPKDAAGSKYHPYVLPKGKTEKDVPPGSYYVPEGGGVKFAADPNAKQGSFIEGLAQGPQDIALSMAQLAPQSIAGDIRKSLEAEQQLYDAANKGNLASGLGRFTGQVVGSAPVLAGSESIVAPALVRGGGPIGSFLAGKAGTQALPEGAGLLARLAQLGTRGGSLAASGAGEGALATALTSSASDAPLEDQLKTGAVLGGALKPVGSVVGSGLKRFVGGNRLQGAADIADQASLAEAAKALPVQVPLSLGQITKAPAQQMAENAMLRGAEGDLAAGVMQGFRGQQQEALRGNLKAIGDLVAKREFTPGEGAKAVSETLNTRRDAAKAAIDAAYTAAREKGEDAMLATAGEVREGVLDGLRRDYNLDRIKSVATEIENFGSKGAPTVREVFDLRSRLSNLSQSSDAVEGAAARKAIRGVDAYVETALKNDLFLGDPSAVASWKEAVKKRADYGRLFEGDDLIEGLTERVSRGGGSTLKVDPEEAANYILNRSDLGFVGKKNLGRDLKRLRGVLGDQSDEWNGLRAEVFSRLAKAGEGTGEGGAIQFSGQKFLKSWEKAKRDDPQVIGIMFTPDERKLIDQFAEVSQVVTTPVKGGDNSSNSAITAKRLLGPMGRFLSVSGGAGGGATLGGAPGAAAGAAFGFLMKELGDILAAGKAKRFTYDAKPVAAPDLPTLKNSLLGTAASSAGQTAGVIAGRNMQPSANQ